jgi:glycosyltransferase involved in cell wall biosynthesis
MSKPRVAVVSPSVDKSHGTERHVAEQLPRLAEHYEIHLYSQRLEDVDPSKITWHPVARLPGPHILNYLWWFAANHIQRWWDRRFRGLHHDLVFSTGINCLDADFISVHIVFAELYQRVHSDLTFRATPVQSWPRLIHRHLYYRLLIALERRIYADRQRLMSAISQKTADDLKRLYGCVDDLVVTYAGIDNQTFNPARRNDLRHGMRQRMKLTDGTFALLLIGNGWHNKGLPTLIEALQLLKELPLCLLVVGQDDPRPFQNRIQAGGLAGKIRFLAPRPDVVSYYAAADCYVGPSLEDAFAQPPAEARACGLPVIVSVQAGVSELVTHGVDGFVLNDPRDSVSLAKLISGLYSDPELRRRMGKNAARTARQYTWERNAEQFQTMFEAILRSKAHA